MKSILLIFFLSLLKGEVLKIKNKKIGRDENCAISSENNSTTLAMGNCHQNIYFIQMGIGTPSQYFNFQIDTTTELMWFPMHSGFNFQDSSTLEIYPKQKTAKYHFQYNISGYAGADFVTLVQTSISTKSEIFWVDQEIQIPFSPEISGIVGMGFSEVPNFLDNAFIKKQINSPIFAMEMTNSDYSFLYFNNLPSPLEYNTHYVPVIGKGLWKFQLKGLNADSSDLSFYANSNVILDSGLNKIQFNGDLYDFVKEKYFKSCIKSKLNDLQCPCSTYFPDFGFILDQIEVFIHSQSYIQQFDNKCLVKIGRAENITLGDIFFKEYIITFDKLNKKVGFTGDVLSIHLIGSEYFQLTQYIIMSLCFLIMGFGIYLLFYLNTKKEKKKSDKKTPFFIEIP